MREPDAKVESPSSAKQVKEKKSKGRRIAGDKELGIDSYDEDSDMDDNLQEEQYDYLANNIDFSEDEDVEEEGGLTIKNAAKYAELERKPERNMKGDVIPRVNELGYYKRVEKITVYPFEATEDKKQRYLGLKKAYKLKQAELDRNFGIGGD